MSDVTQHPHEKEDLVKYLNEWHDQLSMMVEAIDNALDDSRLDELRRAAKRLYNLGRSIVNDVPPHYHPPEET